MECDRKLYKGLIIGKDAEITGSSDPSLVGKRGKIVDETKNTIVLKQENGKTVRIAKSIVRFSLFSKDRSQSSLTLEGQELVATPQERIKG